MSTEQPVAQPQHCRACMQLVTPRPYRVPVTRHQSGHPGISLEFDRIEWRCPKCGERGLQLNHKEHDAQTV